MAENTEENLSVDRTSVPAAEEASVRPQPSSDEEAASYFRDLQETRPWL